MDGPKLGERRSCAPGISDPAEEIDDLNAAMVGEIEVIRKFR
jgi:hypothetical protein